MKEKRIIYIGFAFAHHKSTHSGYHQIKNYINYDKIIDCQTYIEKCNEINLSLIRKIYRKIFRKIFFFPEFPFFLVKCIWFAMTQQNTVFHFIYGENLYKWKLLHWACRKSNKISLTLHQPYDWFIENKWSGLLKSVDEIILVSDQEIELFKAITKKNNVYYVPHGIDTEFYSPNLSIKKENIILTVGNWLRDFNFANKVYQKLLENHPNLQIVIVSNPENKKYISKSENILFLSNITDEQLRDLYRKCVCVFLPLIKYTANNALLEAGATGCNIVIASDNSENSYIPPHLIHLSSMKINECVEYISYYITGKVNNRELALFINKEYKWEKIGKITENILLK